MTEPPGELPEKLPGELPSEGFLMGFLKSFLKYFQRNPYLGVSCWGHTYISKTTSHQNHLCSGISKITGQQHDSCFTISRIPDTQNNSFFNIFGLIGHRKGSCSSVSRIQGHPTPNQVLRAKYAAPYQIETYHEKHGNGSEFHFQSDNSSGWTRAGSAC